MEVSVTINSSIFAIHRGFANHNNVSNLATSVPVALYYMAIFTTTSLSSNLIKTTIITDSILSIVINYVGPISVPINCCICATCRGSSTYNDNC